MPTSDVALVLTPRLYEQMINDTELNVLSRRSLHNGRTVTHKKEILIQWMNVEWDFQLASPSYHLLYYLQQYKEEFHMLLLTPDMLPDHSPIQLHGDYDPVIFEPDVHTSIIIN